MPLFTYERLNTEIHALRRIYTYISYASALTIYPFTVATALVLRNDLNMQKKKEKRRNKIRPSVNFPNNLIDAPEPRSLQKVIALSPPATPPEIPSSSDIYV